MLLLTTVVEDGGHVLPRGTSCWIVVLPEHVKELAVAGLLWVKLDLDGLRVVATEGEVPAKTAYQSI